MDAKRTVFVFGAGASFDEGLPFQEKLLKAYFQNQQSDDSFKVELSQYFKDFFEINVEDFNNVEFPTFEEALGIIELAIEKEETYGPNYSLEKLRKIRTALILSIGVAIEKCNLNRNNSYGILVRKLFHKGHFQKDEYGFVSLNYDILLDKALMKILAHDIYVDYGISFANEDQRFVSDDFQKWISPTKDRGVAYYKLHGSFNWLCCPTCNSIYIKGSSKGNIFNTGYLHDMEHCVKDQSELYCIIEPPSFFKKYKNIYLQNIWEKSFDVLSGANKIIFIGFSMNEADIWFKYLLKKCCFHKKKLFVIINPGSEEIVKPKYERLLGKTIYHQISFHDFIKDHKKYLG